MIDPEAFRRISDKLDAFEPQMVQLQIDLCAIPALSPENGGDGEFQKAVLLLDRLREFGLNDIRECPSRDPRVSSGLRPNLLVWYPGNNTERTVWILTHIDIVPPGETSLWESDPYRARVLEGRIYGRGTEDNQQDLVASIFALRAFIETGVRPEYSIGLALVSDEETSSRFGVRHLLDLDPPVFRRNDLIVAPDFGDADGRSIEIAEKSLLWLRFRTSGRQCHGSRPDLGRNAFTAASHLVVRLRELYDLFPDEDALYQPGRSTFEATKKEPNVPNVNTIPGEDVFYLDARILPVYPLKTVVDAARRLADEIEREHDVRVQVDSVQEVHAPAPTPSDAPIVDALRQAVRTVYSIDAKPVGIGAGTVAALLRQRGYPVAVWSRQSQMAHQPNEYCVIANMIGNAKVFAHLCMNTV